MKYMEFIKSLEERDERYYRVALIRCEDWIQEVLRRVRESDQRCHEKCREKLVLRAKKRSEDFAEQQRKELEDLTAKIKEFEISDAETAVRNPGVDRKSLEMSTELVIELQRELIARKEDKFREEEKYYEEVLENFDQAYSRSMRENMELFADTLREDNAKIIADIRSSDEKFRNVLMSRMICPLQPLSSALRDALIRDRDTGRELRLMKRITDWSLCETNDRDNEEVIATFS